MKIQKLKQVIFKRRCRKAFCLLLAAAFISASLPLMAYPAANPMKYIYAEQQAFVPLLGETTTVTWNLQNRHPVSIYVTAGDEVVRRLVADEEYRGGYVPHETTWDGKDDDGNLVPAGTYRFIVEPQDKYIRHKSITEIYVVSSLTEGIDMLPNLEGNAYLVYGNKGKNQGVLSASLSITENGKDTAGIYTPDVQAGDNIWYARIPMAAYKLYRFSASIRTASGTESESMTAARHIFRPVDRMELLGSYYYRDYKKDAALLADNTLPSGVFNRGHLVGQSILVKNPLRKPLQDIPGNEDVVYQHLGLIDQIEGTAPESAACLNMGNNYYFNADISIDGFSPLFLQRMYNSMSGAPGEFGLNWTFTFSGLLHDMGDMISIQFEDGHIEHYEKEEKTGELGENSGYRAPEGLQRTLLKNADGSYTLTTDGTRKLHFTSSGRLLRVEELNGQKTELQYYDGMLVRASNISGTFDFAYHADGTVKSVTDSGGRTVSYSYTDGLLTGFTDTAGSTVSYNYDSSGRLASAASAEGVVLYEVKYDSSSRVLEKTAGGLTYRYAYDDAAHTIQCTEPGGNVVTYSYTEDYRILKEADSEGEILYSYDDEAGNGREAIGQPASEPVEGGMGDTYGTEGQPAASVLSGDAMKQPAGNFSAALFSAAPSINHLPTENPILSSSRASEGTDSILELKTSSYNASASVDNTLYPNFLITNTGSEDISLSDLTIRYYYTADGTMPPVFRSDWAGRRSGDGIVHITEHVTGKFIRMAYPVTGADCYMEAGFGGNAGTIKPGETVEAHTRISKQNWEDFNTMDDYSRNPSEQEYTVFHQADVFYKGSLVWGDGLNGDGTEIPVAVPEPTAAPQPTAVPVPTAQPLPTAAPAVPEPTALPTPKPFIPKGKDRLKMQMHNAGGGSGSAGTIQPLMRLVNEGSNMVKLSSVTIRYYYTIEEDVPQVFTCDWSSTGSAAVTGTFHKLDEKFHGADSYVEIGFTDEAGYIGIGTAADIHLRIHKEGWAAYDQTDDFSWNPSGTSIAWEKADIFVDGVRVWGAGLTQADEDEPEERIDYADNTYTPLRVEMYSRSRENRTNTISPAFRIYNTGLSGIRLSDISIDYFYTADGPEAQQFSADWVSIGRKQDGYSRYVPYSAVTCSFSEVDDYNLMTYCIAEIGFTRDDILLGPGEYIELQARINRPEWTKYVQVNDFSYNPESTDYEEWIKVSAFVGERWVYGSMPLSYAEITDPDPEPIKGQEAESKESFTSVTDKAGNTSSYVFDEKGNALSFTDAEGNVTEQAYNEWNMPVSVTDALGNTVEYGYDDKGNITKITDARGYVTEYEYSPEGFMTKIIRPDGSTVTAGHDARGNVTRITDGTGAVTRYSYDSLNRMTKHIDADGNVTEFSYTAGGKVSKVTDAYGNTISSAYDRDGRLIKETDEKGYSVVYEYSRETGLLIKETDAAGYSSTYEYNKMNYTSRRTDTAGREITSEYDKYGRVVQETDSSGSVLRYEYDVNGNLLRRTDEDGNTTSFAYDRLGRLIKMTDALGTAGGT